AAPEVTSKTTGAVAPTANIEIVLDETVVKGSTGNIVIMKKGTGGNPDTVFETISVTDAKVTIGGVDNKTVTINPAGDLVAGESYYVEVQSGALKDSAGNDFAGLSGSSAWTFNAADLSTSVAWSGSSVDATDGYINTSELSNATLSGTVSNPAGATSVAISSIVFKATDGSGDITISSSLPTISGNNWTLTNNSSWTSQLVNGKSYTVEVNLSGTLSGNAVVGSGTASSVAIDT
ncbi:Ig-like domain-containing protein, partial [Poseidonibacter ostreae]